MSKSEPGRPGNELEIQMYMHCGLCLAEKPRDVAPRDWTQLEVGWTAAGLQVWCRRHECNVVHVDFQGVQHIANTSRRGDA